LEFETWKESFDCTRFCKRRSRKISFNKLNINMQEEEDLSFNASSLRVELEEP